MENLSRHWRLWRVWLAVVSLGVALFGGTLVLAPGLAQQGFGLLVYGDAGRIPAFGPAATAYIALVHAVLGSVMVGWGLTLLLIVLRFFHPGSHGIWSILVVAILAWFVPDTAFSLHSGFWPNAVLNAVFLVLFAVPLWGTRPSPGGGARRPCRRDG